MRDPLRGIMPPKDMLKKPLPPGMTEKQIKKDFKDGKIDRVKKDEMLRDVYRGFQWVSPKAP